MIQLMIPKRDRLKLPRQDPPTRSAKVRVKDFLEIYDSYSAEMAIEEANRCILCKHEPCVTACPVENHIPQWLELCADGKFMEAATLSHATSNLPEICGRICPQDRLCEKDCVIGIKGDPVAIGAIETFINEWAFQHGFKPELPKDLEKKAAQIAIVGTGPAGLSCGEEMLKLGYQVTFFESHAHPGGLLLYGIPSFKLEKPVVERRIQFLKDMGATFVCNTRIGQDKTISDLFTEGYAAVFLGHGATKAKRAQLPGEQLPGIIDAMPFLIDHNLPSNYKETKAAKTTDIKDKRVVVLGGGDTAMDCVRTAVRLEAKSVVCAYRRNEANMPGSKREIKAAKDEGVQFQFLWQPTKFEANDQGHLAKIHFDRMLLGKPDSQGRQQATAIEGAHALLECDLAIFAFGFDPDEITGKGEAKLKTTLWRSVATDENCMTSQPGVFAGGDGARGADLIVTAIADGRKAAKCIDRYLQSSSI